jgi:hypothetical protein
VDVENAQQAPVDEEVGPQAAIAVEAEVEEAAVEDAARL